MDNPETLLTLSTTNRTWQTQQKRNTEN